MLLGALSNIAFTLFAIAYSPIFLQKIRQEENPKKLLQERWGNFASDRFRPKSSDRQRVWIHAVSVGEVHSLVPLLEQLSKKGAEVFLSTVTPTGQQAARKLVGDRAFYFPFDLSGAVKKTLNVVEPDMILLTETELWPNFILQAGKKNIPLARIRGAFPSCEVTPEALVEKMVPLVRAHGGTFKWGQASMSKGQCRPRII